MSSKVSFEGIGEVIATFYAGDGVTAGQVVKLSGDSKVAACTAGERFCGLSVSVKTGCAAVQVGGFAEVHCTDSTVAVGLATLTADGSGGVKKAGSGDAGAEYLVVSKDTAGFITLKM